MLRKTFSKDTDTILSAKCDHRSLSTTTTSTASSEPFYGSPRKNDMKSLSPLQSIALAAYSATHAYLNPERHDMVATLAEVSGSIALQSMHKGMMSHPTGQRILQDRPLVNTQSIDIPKLKELPSNTFGYNYARFLAEHEFNPNHRADVKYIDDPDLAYVMTRYRQNHDFFHVLTDLPPTVPGELALKYVELFQTGLPICALSSTVGSLKLSGEDRIVWKNIYLPWAIRVGKTGNKKKWMHVYWEEEFERDLQELRDELGIETAPQNDVLSMS